MHLPQHTDQWGPCEHGNERSLSIQY
jgi:hypothetical protein